ALYLASGTDLKYVRAEADLLGLTPYFGEHVYGALDDYKSFSKQLVIERILREHGLGGGALLGFGDGFVEIEEVKKVGGVAVAGGGGAGGRAGRRAGGAGAAAAPVSPKSGQHGRLWGSLFGEEPLSPGGPHPRA